MTNRHKAVFLLPLLLICFFSLGLVGCDKGPFAPAARHQAQELSDYMRVLQNALVTDDTFAWNTLSSALIVRALPYSNSVAEAAQRRFSNEPAFQKETGGWFKSSKRGGNTPTIVLMGLYTPDLAEKDVTKLGRFRPRLRTDDGRLIEPLEIKRYGRDSVFIRDHFPIFNPWEEVFLVKFDYQAGSDPLNFLLEWPGGTQNLLLPR